MSCTCDCFYWLSRFRGASSCLICIKPQLKLFHCSRLSSFQLSSGNDSLFSNSLSFWKHKRETLEYEREKRWRFIMPDFFNWIEWQQLQRKETCCMRKRHFHRKTKSSSWYTLLPVRFIDLLRNQLDDHRCVASIVRTPRHTCYPRWP